MKTAIEILKEEAEEAVLTPTQGVMVVSAMEEYAKQMAIAFAIDYNKGVDDRMDVRYNHFIHNRKL